MRRADVEPPVAVRTHPLGLQQPRLHPALAEADVMDEKRTAFRTLGEADMSPRAHAAFETLFGDAFSARTEMESLFFAGGTPCHLARLGDTSGRAVCALYLHYSSSKKMMSKF